MPSVAVDSEPAAAPVVEQPAVALLQNIPSLSRERPAAPGVRKSPFLTYIHTFRGLAILFIVAGHAISLLDWSGAPREGELLRILLTNGTVFFVFIAGYLFQHLSGKYQFKRYMLGKVQNVVAPYIVVSIPAIALLLLRSTADAPFAGEPALWRIIKLYLSGRQLVQLWFIPMICLYYALSPLLVFLDRRKWFYASLPLLLTVSLCFVPRGDSVPINAVHFLPVYLLGMCFSRWKAPVSAATRRTVPGLAAVAIACIAIEALAPQLGGVSWNLLQKLALCALLLCALQSYRGWLNKPLAYLADLSFGIYFVHEYCERLLRYLSKMWNDGALLPGSLALYVVSLALLLTLSVALLWCCKRFAGRNSRLLVGC